MGKDLSTLLPHRPFPSSHHRQRGQPLPWLVVSILGLVILWEGHKKKIAMSQPLLCASIYLGFWIFSAFNDCLFFLGLCLLLSPASQLLGCPL